MSIIGSAYKNTGYVYVLHCEVPLVVPRPVFHNVIPGFSRLL